MARTNQKEYAPEAIGDDEEAGLIVSDTHFVLEVRYTHEGRRYLERMAFEAGPNKTGISIGGLEWNTIGSDGSHTPCSPGPRRALEYLQIIQRHDERLPSLIKRYLEPYAASDGRKKEPHYSQWFLF